MTGRVCAAGGCEVIAAKVSRIDNAINFRFITSQESFDDIIVAAEMIEPILDNLWDKLVEREDAPREDDD